MYSGARKSIGAKCSVHGAPFAMWPRAFSLASGQFAGVKVPRDGTARTCTLQILLKNTCMQMRRPRCERAKLLACRTSRNTCEPGCSACMVLPQQAQVLHACNVHSKDGTVDVSARRSRSTLLGMLRLHDGCATQVCRCDGDVLAILEGGCLIDVRSSARLPDTYHILTRLAVVPDLSTYLFQLAPTLRVLVLSNLMDSATCTLDATVAGHQCTASSRQAAGPPWDSMWGHNTHEYCRVPMLSIPTLWPRHSPRICATSESVR
ncbi:hypothetical protein B0H15DRAFT_812103 [Mycena belliarum]|uniref:Uncharacterized protein n=1 Tax=Mycena belliarum TaxID=1033014 RepID=A0AAD6UIE8_9AGAR|nr:hypothetical protein B0H15DRAFT_812101 [Mycena belliae]KAJ7103390.1 hypothetical protein B0H15DRAFT_812103 [Mycena belliae]